MNKTKTPDWLIDAQNKSWEPEILISGITLTFLFLLSNYIFNFYGMLIQEFNVRYVVGKNLYNISIIILTGLKAGLIIHLILRGIWTGFVGLSYVFPEGVNKKKIHESKQNINYYKPEKYVIKLEQICSIVFSFVFSSIIFVSAAGLVFIPIALLYITGLDIIYIKYIILFLILPLVFAVAIFSFLLDTKFKNSKLKHKLENSIFNNILNTYFTNLGVIKTSLMFGAYFAIIFLVSLSDISKFNFNNEKPMKVSSPNNMIQLHNDHYLNKRDHKLRISKAAIDQFWVTENTLKLFISFYKEDLYTLKNLKDDPESLSEVYKTSDTTNINLPSIYQIYIDDKPITGLKWYRIETENTNQSGIITKIPLNPLSSGYHELKLDKIYWINKEKEIHIIKNWDIIPFELK